MISFCLFLVFIVFILVNNICVFRARLLVPSSKKNVDVDKIRRIPSDIPSEVISGGTQSQAVIHLF